MHSDFLLQTLMFSLFPCFKRKAKIVALCWSRNQHRLLSCARHTKYMYPDGLIQPSYRSVTAQFDLYLSFDPTVGTGSLTAVVPSGLTKVTK